MNHRFKQFIRDERGAYAVEMAVVAPVLFLLLFSIIEFSLIMYASSILNTVTNQAARYGKTGHDYGNGSPSKFTANANEGFKNNTSTSYYSVDGQGNVTMNSREAFIRKYIQEAGAPFFDAEHLKVTTRLFSNITEAGITGVSSTPYNSGQGAQAVIYEIQYDWRILTPLLMIFGESGTYPIHASVVVKNENF